MFDKYFNDYDSTLLWLFNSELFNLLCPTDSNETKDECEYEYYEYEYNENFKKTQNNEIKQLVEKGFFIENLTTIITNVFTYLKSLIFKLIR